MSLHDGNAVHQAWKPAEPWPYWDDGETAAIQVASHTKQIEGQKPVTVEEFLKAYVSTWHEIMANNGLFGLAWVDRIWRSSLPEGHPHRYDFLLSGEYKFVGVNVPYEWLEKKQKGHVSEETPPTLDPPKPLTKTPLTEDQKFDYRIKKLFEEEKKRYIK